MTSLSETSTDNRTLWQGRTEASPWLATVSAVIDPAPRVRRLTLQAPEFADWSVVGADEYFGLLMAHPERGLTMPECAGVADLRKAVAEVPEDHRPGLRWYTVRAHRPESAEVDVDIVIHTDGPGGAFLARVAVGEVVGFAPGNGHYLAKDPSWEQLLVADETAYPALSAIGELVAREGGTDRIRAIVEAPDPTFLASVNLPFQSTVIERGGEAPGTAVLAHLRHLELPDLDYAWVCGEGGMASAVRKHLTEDRHTPKDWVLFSGYWRLGKARP